MENNKLEQCFNRCCGQKYDPLDNTDDSCRHHPGAPVFHDAYKGWSCCNKKCTDFTEFLNIKGCTLSKHSNIKPVEPEKPDPKESDVKIEAVVEVKPILPPALERPPLDTHLVEMKPEITPSLLSQITEIEEAKKDVKLDNEEIPIGTNCKNGGCTVSFQGSNFIGDSVCLHHPGFPIFHEGLKYWTCCQRKTTDFNSFLNQEGCREGTHLWRKEDNDTTKVQCRWDYHQTGPFMVVSIYAKNYSPSKSIIKLNPIRMYVNLVFPKEDNANFELDIELKGVINVADSKITMYSTKVEIKLKKAEAGNWNKLEANIIKNTKPVKENKELTTKNESSLPKIEDVDLNDL